MQQCADQVAVLAVDFAAIQVKVVAHQGNKTLAGGKGLQFVGRRNAIPVEYPVRLDVAAVEIEVFSMIEQNTGACDDQNDQRGADTHIAVPDI